MVGTLSLGGGLAARREIGKEAEPAHQRAQGHQRGGKDAESNFEDRAVTLACVEWNSPLSVFSALPLFSSPILLLYGIAY